MFDSLRRQQTTAAAAAVVIATIVGVGASRADDQASLVFENTLEQDIILEVYDNYYYDPGVRRISLSRATINGKPSGMGNKVGFKASKNKQGHILLKVTAHCGSSTDAFFYTQPPSGNIRVQAGCKLTRS